jgi:hypothetical protein
MDHQIKFKDAEVLDKTEGYMDQVVKEVKEI